MWDDVSAFHHMNSLLKSLALAALTVTAVTVQAANVSVDPKLPAYAVTSGVSGNLNSVGSDTLNNLMTFWSEGFKAQYPNVKIQVEGKGSGTAPVALSSGVAQVGPMSREMKSTEVAAFAAKFGHKPTRIPVAIDGRAVTMLQAVEALIHDIDGIEVHGNVIADGGVRTTTSFHT